MPKPIRLSIQNLLGGVSQQPNTVRIENQCEVQDNAYPSIVDGLSKRQQSEHVARLSAIESLNQNGALIHWINRDTEERYALVVDSGLDGGSPPSTKTGVKVFDVTTGKEVPVTGKNKGGLDPDVEPYLSHYNRRKHSGPNAKRDLKVLTVADTTYVLNTAKVCEMKKGVKPWDSVDVGKFSGQGQDFRSRSARRWFLFQRTASPLSRYAVNVRTKGLGFLEPPDEIDGDDGNNKGLAWVKTFGLDYKKRPATNSKGFGTKEDIPPYDEATFFSGYQIGTIQTHEVLSRLWSEEGIGDRKLNFYRGGIEFNYNSFLRRTGDRFGDLLTVDGPRGPRVKLPQKGPVMMLQLRDLSSTQGTDSKYRDELRVEVDSTGDVEDSLIAFSDEVDRISQLPLVCLPGHIVKINGLTDSDSDDYYAEFEANADYDIKPNTLVEGHWKEGMASLSLPLIDNSTMPLKMVRVWDPDPTDPTKQYARFEIYLEDWAIKTVGDDESNPNPSFIGQTIQDIFLWRNRLGFLSGSRFIMSEADEYTNFWRTTVKTLLDSDPIDLDAGHADVADLRFATPMEEELIIWSDRTQFVVQGDPILTPRTAGLTPTTEFECYRDVRPEVLEDGIFYALRSGGGGFSQVRQFHRVQDAAGSFSSRLSSVQIPRYIAGEIAEMTSTSVESVLVCRTDDTDNGHVLYVYKWHDDGPGRRILSSWSRFLVGPSSDTKVHGVRFFDDELYMVVERVNGTNDFPIYLEKITFSGPSQSDTDSTFRCLLDRRITDDDCTASYNTTTSTVDIQLPYLVEDDATTRIVSRAGATTGPEGEQFAYTLDITTTAPLVSVLKVKDPQQTLWTAWQSQPRGWLFYVGQDYTMTYEFSRPNLRESREGRATQNIATGRLQLLRGHVSYENTGYMKLDVSPALHANGTTIIDRSTRTYHVPMLEVGLGRSYVGVVNVRDGVLKFGIRAQPEHIRIQITNSTPYPCSPKGIEYEAAYSRRSRMTAF